jgi:hypothetical protein
MFSVFKRFWLKNLRDAQEQPAKSRRRVTLVLEDLECRLIPSANYYVSPSGNDGADGRSPTTAWRTISKVANTYYGPGDTISFQGGATFNGSLGYLYGGTVTNPLTLNSYGGGRATIASGQNGGVAVYNSGLVISDLNLVGAGGSGIVVIIVRAAVSHFHVSNVDISGYGGYGIQAYVDPVGSLQDVRITGVSVHDCVASGDSGGKGAIDISGDDSAPSVRQISDLVIDHVQVFNNYQQFGIYLTNINGGVVQWSEVHDISSRANTLGITAWDSDYVNFQHNEAYDITDPTLLDGDGFLLGNGVNSSVLEYNYSHNNGGFGLALVADIPGRAANTGNTVRYNISENDSVFSPHNSGIVVAGNVSNAEIYNDTVYMAGDGLTRRYDLVILNWTGAGLHFRNNIFQVAPGNAAFWTNLNSGATGQDLLFQGNAYWIDDGSFRVGYIDREFSSLSDWENATGQELLYGSVPTGYAGDPQLVAPGQGGTIGDPDLLPTLSAYNLQPGSPLNQAGLDLLGLFGVDPGSQDFYGNPLVPANGFSVGAYQGAGGALPQGKLSLQGVASPVVQASYLDAPIDSSVSTTPTSLPTLVWNGETYPLPDSGADGNAATLLASGSSAGLRVHESSGLDRVSDLELPSGFGI